ncbi:MAG: TonB-dependent receptor [Bacteroidales bacterium]|nr:TonB-dependent receptor [Bacteroidales bacterium]
MNRKNLILKEIVTFKKWANTSWSVFSSIGKLIRIASLPLSYFLTSVFTLNAQTDTVQIDDIQIVSSRVPTLNSETARVIYTIEKDEIESLPVHSLQDLLEYASNVDVRQRGTEGVQADISIRGGNYEQTLILLNGFKMNDVQTGHHNMNLPVDIESIEKIEILQGPGNRIFGINAYSGAINFITNTETAKKLKLSLFAGQHQYFGGNASLSYNIKNWQNYISFSKKTSGGYLPNDDINNTDFNTLNIFYETALKTKFSDYIIQTGYSDKSFGANSFYTPKFPWQYENTKTIFAGYKAISHKKNYNFLKSFYWRRHQDRFELFREDKFMRTGNYFINETDTAKYYPGIYANWNYYSGHNYHKTNIISSELKFDFNTIAGKTAVGAEYRHVYIQSNVLGEDMKATVDVPFEEFGEYTKSADRYNVNLYAEHVYQYKNLMVAGGFSSNYNSDYNWYFTGGIDISYNIGKEIKLFASANQALRLPTFTDLYYDGPTNKGNPDLLPEQALTYETGLKYRKKRFKANLTVFKRKGRNTIDWVRLSDTIDWQPLNITELTTVGTEVFGSYNFQKADIIKKIAFSYSHIDITKQSGEYISKYALDYLKHKIVFSMHHKIFKNISAAWALRYEDRAGSFSAYDITTKTYTGEKEYTPFTLLDLKVFWKTKRFEIYTEASNLLNTEYYEYGNIKMPGLWIKAGVRLKLNL